MPENWTYASLFRFCCSHVLYRFDPYHSAQYFIFYPICLHKHIREFSFTQTHMRRKKHTPPISLIVCPVLKLRGVLTVRKVYTYVAIFVATKRCKDCKSDEIAHPIQHPKHTNTHIYTMGDREKSSHNTIEIHLPAVEKWATLVAPCKRLLRLRTFQVLFTRHSYKTLWTIFPMEFSSFHHKTKTENCFLFPIYCSIQCIYLEHSILSFFSKNTNRTGQPLST